MESPDIEEMLSHTAHSITLHKRLKENDENSAAANWIERNMKLLNKEREVLERILKEAKDKDSRIAIITPITPTTSGAYIGHHATYQALKHFSECLISEYDEAGIIEISAILLDQRSSSFMKKYPMKTNSSKHLIDYPEVIKRIRLNRRFRPKNIDGHIAIFQKYFANNRGKEQKIGVAHKVESELFREMIADDELMEILRQSSKIIEQFADLGEAIDFEKRKDYNGYYGTDLTLDVLSSVVLHAANKMFQRNGIDYCIILCGGDMFDELSVIRNMLLTCFGDEASPCQRLEDLVILTTPKAESIRLSSTEVFDSKDNASYDRETIRKLLENGSRRDGILLDDNKMEEYINEIIILIGTDNRAPIHISNEEMTITNLTDLGKLSKLTPKSATVINELNNHKRKIGKTGKKGLTHKELCTLLMPKDDDSQTEKRDKVTPAGIHVILKNLIALKMVYEAEGEYVLNTSKIHIDFDTMLQ